MDNFILIIVYFLTISIAVERVIEICKNTVLKDKVHNGVVWQIMALMIGALISYFQPIPVSIGFPRWLEIAITGAATSGGSGFWNSILETAYEFKKSLVASRQK